MLTVDYDRLDVRPGMTVLDLGCGEGRHAFEAYRRGAARRRRRLGRAEVEHHAAVVGAIAAAGEAPGGRAAEVVRGDLRALPFPDASVDRVIAAEVLEHIPDDATAIAEIARVLKPGGRVAVTVPRYGPGAGVLGAVGRVPRQRGRARPHLPAPASCARRLRGAGLVPGDRHHAHALHAPYWWLKCAVGVERGHRGRPRLPPAARLGPDRAAAADPRGRARAGPGARQERGRSTPTSRRVATGRRRPAPAARPTRTGADRCRAADRPGRLPELPGVLTARRRCGHVAASPPSRTPTARSLVPRRPAGPVGLRRGGDGARRRRRARPGAGRLPVAGRAAAAGRVLGGASTATARETAPAAESNHAGYLAVGAWHRWLCTGDEALVGSCGRRCGAALDLVVRMQRAGGAIGWALRPDGTAATTSRC